MKKVILSMAAAALMLVGCGTNGTLGQLGTAVLGEVINSQTGSTNANSGQTIGNILQSVLGLGATMTQQNLIGTWSYSQPGCAFTSEKLLAQAGGEVVASQIKSKLAPSFKSIGIKSSNTKMTFKEDGTFSATIAGKSFSGNYTFDESTSKITMQGMLLTINCYAKKNSDGIAILFESSKLLSLLQTLSALSGNTSLSTVGDLAKSYDGLRLGFDMK